MKTPVLYGVRCRNCGASIPATHAESKNAIRLWNRRSGLATLGGKATRGKVSRRKLAAIRRNLKKARETRQLSRLRRMAETAYATLRFYRQQERELIEAEVAKSPAELNTMGPLLRKDSA